MHLYIAGMWNAGAGVMPNSSVQNRITDTAKGQILQVAHRLESYHYMQAKFSNHMRTAGYKIFLDSGAYSAWTKGVIIDVEEYAQYLKDNHDIIRMASVLDKVGNTYASALETWNNFKVLEQRDCPTIPCYHVGEPPEVAKYYADNYEYISLGGLLASSISEVKEQLDDVWTHALTDNDGYAKCKVHGFGMTSVALMERYPWYSVDSTSWVMMAAYGSVVFPEIKKPIDVSEQSPSRKMLAQHITTMTKPEQDYLHQLADKYGLDLEHCAKDYAPRYAFNAYAFHKIGEDMGEDHWRKPFKHRQRRLF